MAISVIVRDFGCPFFLFDFVADGYLIIFGGVCAGLGGFEEVFVIFDDDSDDVSSESIFSFNFVTDGLLLIFEVCAGLGDFKESLVCSLVNAGLLSFPCCKL